MAKGVSAARATGFTLLETMLVAALVSILVALIIPSLRGLRGDAEGLRSLSNLRTHSAVVSSYAADYKDLFPYLTSPTGTSSVIRCVSAGVAVEARYFDASQFWYVGLADGYYAGDWTSASFRAPRDPEGGEWRGRYLLSCTTIADPLYYNPSTRRDPPDQLRPVKQTEVLFPSYKGVVVEHHNALTGASAVRGGMADGSALRIPAHRRLAAYDRGDGWFLRFTSHYPDREPLCHTLDGVRGRDVHPGK